MDLILLILEGEIWVQHSVNRDEHVVHQLYAVIKQFMLLFKVAYNVSVTSRYKLKMITMCMDNIIVL